MALLLQQVNCIDRAYKDALENFREDAGSDGRTFGMDVYTFTWYQIRESKSVEITRNEPFWFSLNGASVACHKVGKDLKKGISSSLPRDTTGWPPTVPPQQMGLFGEEAGIPVSDILVLAHIGNPKAGLLAVHLCRPMVDQDGSLKHWVDERCIWRAGQSMEVQPTLQKVGTLRTKPPEVIKPMPLVALKPQEETKPKPVVKLKKPRKDKDASE